MDWTSVSMDTFFIDSSQNLLNGEIYYAYVRAIDGVGNISSEIGSDGMG